MYTKNELIERFFTLYKKYGFKSVTVDDLSHEMGISKKTLYQEFENRDEIVENVIIYFINNLKKIISDATLSDIDTISKLVKLYTDIIGYLTSINPVFYFSLRKHYQKVTPLFENYRDDFLYPALKKLFLTGIRERVFREDIDIEYFLKAQDALIMSFLNEEFSDISTPMDPKRFLKLILNNIRGRTTIKGCEKLDKVMQANDGNFNTA